jgi:zinc/manganese transport system ATP-binding protein
MPSEHVAHSHRGEILRIARLRGVTVLFPGARALVDADVDIPAGRITALVGPNGAGKTTLLEVLAGVRRPTAGVREVHARTVGFVPQRTRLPDRLPVTVHDVVSVGTWGRRRPPRNTPSAAKDAVRLALARMDLAEIADRPFGSLSGGQRQRALLAQGLARHADLLLLDEPTTALDRESADRIRAAIREEAEAGAAVVCVSHDAALIHDADLRVTLHEGRIL